jgi:hypothetical protein
MPAKEKEAKSLGAVFLATYTTFWAFAFSGDLNIYQ